MVICHSVTRSSYHQGAFVAGQGQVRRAPSPGRDQGGLPPSLSLRALLRRLGTSAVNPPSRCRLASQASGLPALLGLALPRTECVHRNIQGVCGPFWSRPLSEWVGRAQSSSHYPGRGLLIFLSDKEPRLVAWVSWEQGCGDEGVTVARVPGCPLPCLLPPLCTLSPTQQK